MKRCPSCGETKTSAEFYPIQLKRKDGRIEPGLAPYCRKCSKQRAAKYQRERYKADPEYRARHHQQTAESERRKRASDPEYAKAVSERRKRNWLAKKRKEVEASAGQVPPKLCIDCGADISERHWTTKYCPDCKRARRQATVRNYVARTRRKSLG